MSKQREPALVRCTWAGNDAEYQRYHDEEWGVPLKTDRAIFEKLVLEGFQAGLSWITILRKRENFRRAFEKFDPKRIASYGAKDVARLMADQGIVRNRAKIEATVDNAKAYLHLRKRTTLKNSSGIISERRPGAEPRARHEGHPGRDGVVEAHFESTKEEGFRFVGPTTVYAFMQSIGDGQRSPRLLLPACANAQCFIKRA